MKKLSTSAVLSLIVVTTLIFSCKKESDRPPTADTTVYLRIQSVDNNNAGTTESTVKIIKLK